MDTEFRNFNVLVDTKASAITMSANDIYAFVQDTDVEVHIDGNSSDTESNREIRKLCEEIGRNFVKLHKLLDEI